MLCEIEQNQTAMAKDLVKKVRVIDAITMLFAAWSKVSSATIKNCFSKAFELDGQDLNCNENDSYDLLGDVQVPLNMEMHEFVDAIDFDEEKDFEIEQSIYVDVAGGEEEEDVPDTVAVSTTTAQAMTSLAALRSWSQEIGMS